MTPDARRPVQHPFLVAVLGSARIWGWFDTVLLLLATACLAVVVSGWVVIAYYQGQVVQIGHDCSGDRCVQQLTIRMARRATVPGGGAYSISSRTDVCDLTAAAPAGTYSARFPGRACGGLAAGSPARGLIWRGRWLRLTNAGATWDAESHPENGIGTGLLLQLTMVGVLIFGGVLRVDLRTRWPPLRRFI